MDDAQAIDAKVSLAVALLDRARVLLEAGPAPRVRRLADRGRRRCSGPTGCARTWREVELARAECALLDGEIAAARRLAATARDRFRRRGNDRWRRDAELVLLHADLRRRPARVAGWPDRRCGWPRSSAATGLDDPGPDQPADRRRGAAAGRAGPSRPATVAAEAGPVRPADPISARLHTRLVRGPAVDRRRRHRHRPPRGPHRPGRAGQPPGPVRQHRPADRQRGARPAAGRAGPVDWRWPTGGPPGCSPRSSAAGRPRSRLPPVSAPVGPGGRRAAGRAAARRRGAALDPVRRRAPPSRPVRSGAGSPSCSSGCGPGPGRPPARAARRPSGVAGPDRGGAEPRPTTALVVLLRRRRAAARRRARPAAGPGSCRSGPERDGVGDWSAGSAPTSTCWPAAGCRRAARRGLRDAEPVAGRRWTAAARPAGAARATGW